LLTDFAVITFAVAVAHVTRYYLVPGPMHRVGAYLYEVSIGLVVAWMIFLMMFRTREPRILDSGYRQYQAVARASFNLFAAIAIVALVSKLQFSRGFIAMAGILGVSLLFLSRHAWRLWIYRHRATGALTANVLVIGGVRSAKTMARRFAADPGLGFRVVGVWVPDRAAAADELFTVGSVEIPVYGTDTDFGSALRLGAVDHVVVTDSEHLGHDGMRELAWALEGRAVELLVAPNVVDVAGPRVHLEAHGNMPLIYLTGPTYSRTKTVGRAIFDRLFAAAVLVGTVPILAVAALAIRLTSRGPILYRSERIGTDGVPFQLYKLRTMVVDADAKRESLMEFNMGSGPLFKMRDDPRVTPVGRFLRRFSIDELPQFINVLKGDMSVVGPRPHLPGELDQYGELGKRRLLVKQGVTGLWQVSGRSDLSWEDAVRLDLDYVENWSMMGDLQIILRTLRAVIRSDGAY
jgi:exopolysaccharide biosynthesis polyprenyl glycosylphosphotransferase